MTDLDQALDDLDAADVRALKRAAWEHGVAAAHEPRMAAFWHALAVVAAEAEDRRTTTLRALEDDLLGIPPAS